MTSYSFQQAESEKMVKVVGKNLPISYKASYEVANALRGKMVIKAIALLRRVVEGTEAIPYNRYNRDVPHKKGKIVAGRYPLKVSQNVLSLLNSIIKNAESKHLNTDGLKIIHIASQKGPRIMHSGRTGGRRKITHFEIVAEEISESKVKPAGKKEKIKK